MADKVKPKCNEASVRRLISLITMLLLVGCAKVLAVRKVPEVTVGDAAFFRTMQAHTSAPIVEGNRVEVLLNGDETFPRMLRDIKSAKSTITFAQYLYEGGSIGDEFAHAFAERCRAGVKADILLDRHGSGKMPANIIRTMKEAGCNVEYFRQMEADGIIFPWRLLRYNYRSHRRVLVIDGRIGFTGGYGVSEAWAGNGRMQEHWRDTNVRIEGPVVSFLQTAFAESWLETTGIAIGGDNYLPRLDSVGSVRAQIVKSSPLGGSFQNYMLFLLSINSAKKSILITNPYFIPDEVMTEALVKAAARGVRIAILTPGTIDNRFTYTASRSHYGPLLLGGVEIFEYKAAFMHAKTIVVDGVWATIGSTNIDNRSFALNQEVNLTVHDSAVARRLEEIFREDLKYSEPVTYEQWRSRGIFERLFEFFSFPIKEQL
ncbi:MAG TPA: phospholipase D-like domain-containing protein [Candidatus Polarisedimenticolaceae bacterium]|nr:phospholipase D-like domain-containing protein [Candidatus Polarisedimenticolaceae bacterium]